MNSSPKLPLRIVMLIRGHLVSRVGAPAVGGAGRQCLKLSRTLVQQGHQVTILTDRLRWRDPARAVVEGVPTVYLNSGRPFTDRRGFRRLGLYAFMFSALGYLAQHRHEYDVIHGHSGRVSGFLAVLAGRWLRKKSIFLLMNSGVRNDVLQLRDDTRLPGAAWMMGYLQHADAVIALNEPAVEELRALGFDANQIALIYNGVELDAIAAKDSYGTPGCLRLIFVGRLAPEKCVGRLIAAVALGLQRQPGVDLQLAVLGRGAEQPMLEAQAQALGIASHVHFLGESPDVPSHLARADAFVLPSYGEGLSNALLEAMAAGLPCITTDMPGNNALIRHGQNGLLVRHCQDPLELAEAITRLAQDVELRARLGRAARCTVEAQFDLQQVAGRYVDLYTRLLRAAR